MAYLFDTSAISEVLRRRPNPEFLAWVRELPREEQYTSTVVVGELYVAAFKSSSMKKWVHRIEETVLPSLTILPYDLQCARAYGQIRAALERKGLPIGDADTQIAATAVAYGLTLVTGNVRHFARVPDLPVRGLT
jgi:tRNA(fMet)-specific endonuclease VapC